MPDSRPDSLHELYESAIYEVDFADGRECFHTGHNTSSRPPFFVVTAYNPGHERPSAETNEQANRELETALHEANITFLPASGRNPEGTHVEPSFALFGVPTDRVLTFARRFGQAAVFHWDGDRGSVLCD